MIKLNIKGETELKKLGLNSREELKKVGVTSNEDLVRIGFKGVGKINQIETIISKYLGK